MAKPPLLKSTKCPQFVRITFVLAVVISGPILVEQLPQLAPFVVRQTLR